VDGVDSFPFRYTSVPEPSEGVDFIVERTLDPAPKEPLWVVSLGERPIYFPAMIKSRRLLRSSSESPPLPSMVIQPL